MISLATLLVFLLAVLTLFLSPGPNMAFVLSHGMAHGPRGGFAAALGIGLADLVMAVLTACGVTAVVAAWPPAFDLLRTVGALYLVWLAIKALRTPGAALAGAAVQTSLRGSMALQLLELGLVLSLASVVFNTTLGYCSGWIGQYLQRNPRFAQTQRWFLAGVLLALALRLFYLERPAPT